MVDIKKQLEDLAKIAASHGVSLDMGALSKDAEQPELVRLERKKEDLEYRNGIRLLLNRQHYAHSTMARRCGWCKLPFVTTYCYQQFCSYACEVAEFTEHFKIDPRKLKTPRSEWQYEPTAYLTSSMTKWLYEFAKQVVSQVESLPAGEAEELPEDYPTDQDLSLDQIPDQSPAAVKELDLSDDFDFDEPDEIPQPVPPTLPEVLEEPHLSAPTNLPTKLDMPNLLDDLDEF